MIKIQVHTEEAVKQKDVPERHWYVTKEAYTRLWHTEGLLSSRQFADRLMMFLRQRKPGQALWCLTWHGTEVRAYTQEEVFLVDVEVPDE